MEGNDPFGAIVLGYFNRSVKFPRESFQRLVRTEDAGWGPFRIEDAKETEETEWTILRGLCCLFARWHPLFHAGRVSETNPLSKFRAQRESRKTGLRKSRANA
jgi:hypothetical protein